MFPESHTVAKKAPQSWLRLCSPGYRGGCRAERCTCPRDIETLRRRDGRLRPHSRSSSLRRAGWRLNRWHACDPGFADLRFRGRLGSRRRPSVERSQPWTSKHPRIRGQSRSTTSSIMTINSASLKCFVTSSDPRSSRSELRANTTGSSSSRSARSRTGSLRVEPSASSTLVHHGRTHQGADKWPVHCRHPDGLGHDDHRRAVSGVQRCALLMSAKAPGNSAAHVLLSF